MEKLLFQSHPLLLDHLPLALLLTCSVLALFFIAFAVQGTNWASLKRVRTTQHLFWGSVVAVSLLWYLRAGILPGLEFHILGYTAVMLMMGWRLALLAAAFVQVLMLISGKFSWMEFGYQYVFFSVLPILFSYGFYLLVYRRLSHNPFIYILIAGFINAGVTQAFTDVIRSALLWLLNVYPADVLWHDYLRYLPMMMFPEGVVNGMFISGMVAFHPRWLSTFDEDSYFN